MRLPGDDAATKASPRNTGSPDSSSHPSLVVPCCGGASFFSERVDHADAEARRIGAARRVAEEHPRRDRRVAEGLERVGVIGDARRDRVKLRALRKRVTVARRDLASLLSGRSENPPPETFSSPFWP